MVVRGLANVCTTMKRHNAFTLVELLVVVAIISLLMSLLIPALNKARDLARTTRCGSNLRTIGQGFSLYVNDFMGWLPPVDAMKSHASSSEPWYFTKDYQMWHSIGPYLGNPEWGGFTSDGDFTKTVRKGRIRGTVWYCPDPRDPGWGGVHPQLDYPPAHGYLESGYLKDDGGWDTIEYPRRAAAVALPSAAVHVADAYAFRSSNGKAYNPKWLGSAKSVAEQTNTQFDLYRHNNGQGAMILFADSHATYHTRDDVLNSLTYFPGGSEDQTNFRLR